MKLRFTSSLCATVLLTSTAAFAQAPPAATENGLANSALVTLPAKGGAKLTVTSPAFKNMGDIPNANTQYGANTFPGLEWTAGPAGTQTYAVIMQDTDGAAGGNGIFLHWTAFNIKGTKLDAAMTALPSGTNGPGMGRGGYAGPRTPAGPKHRYHFQVFALDTTLPDAAGATINSLTAAMKDHVLASGEIIGLGQVDPNAPAGGGARGRGGPGGGAPGGGPGGGGAPGGRGGGAPGGRGGGAPGGRGGGAPGGGPGGGGAPGAGGPPRGGGAPGGPGAVPGGN